jgi:hypothetical protein
LSDDGPSRSGIGIGIGPEILIFQATITLNGVGHRATPEYKSAITAFGVHFLAADPDMFFAR